MSFSCKKCCDEGFDFGPKAVQIACTCPLGLTWAARQMGVPGFSGDNAAIQKPATQLLSEGSGATPRSDKAGINEKGEVWRYFIHNGSKWVARDRFSPIGQLFWVVNAAGKYGIWGCAPGAAPGDLVNDNDDPCQLWAVAPFAPDRPDLDPPEVRQ